VRDNPPPAHKASVNGSELAYRIRGARAPIVCIHGALLADAFLPLVAQPALAERYQLLTYHRRGYGDSAHVPEPASLSDQAADCRALLAHLGIERAHVIGHSSGALMALQLALDAPQVVHSLILLEPGVLPVPSAEQFVQRVVEPAGRSYAAGEKAEAVDIFCRRVFGEQYRAVIERALPAGVWKQAVADLDTVFQVELPALQQWQFTREDAAHIEQPALSVQGAESGAMTGIFPEAHRLMLEWLPNVEEYVLPRATHLLQMMNPEDLAEATAAFCARRFCGRRSGAMTEHRAE
jgi:pimeloyl-ACP methyl ester carboxylesterase